MMSESAQATVHEMDFPYYSLRDGFDSTLRLVNDSPDAISFVLSVYSMKGESLVLPPMTIRPDGNLALNLGSLLAEAGDGFKEGSASISYQAQGHMPLAGQITIQHKEAHLVYESRMAENDPGMSSIPAVLNALWWGLHGK